MRAFFLILIAASLLFGTYTRDAVTATVYDDETGLIWQDEPYTQAEENAYVANTEAGKVLFWSSATDYCENLDYAGMQDWRLPNKNELLSITDFSRVFPAVEPTFVNVTSHHYWSSTTFAGGASIAWFVGFDGGYSGITEKTESGYVRCVRGGHVSSSASAVSVPLSPFVRLVTLLLFGLAGLGFMRRRG